MSAYAVFGWVVCRYSPAFACYILLLLSADLMERLRRTWKLRSSLRTQLMLWFGGLSLAIMVGVGFYMGRIATNDVARFGGESLHVSAQSAAALLGTNLREREQEIHLLAHSALLTQGHLDSKNIRLSLELRQSAHREYAWIGVADTSGRVVQATEGLLLNEQVSQRPWFTAGRNGLFVGDMHHLALRARQQHPRHPAQVLQLIDFSAPVLDESGRVKAVVGAHAHWSWVTETVESVMAGHPAEQQIEVLIADRSGRILYPSRHAGLLQLPPTAQPQAHFERLPWGDGDDYLTSMVAVAPSPQQNLGWRIVLRQPVEVALAPVRALRDRLLLLGLGAVLMFTVMAYWFAVRISHPIEQLVRAARRIEQRRGDPVYPAGGHVREIRLLSHSIQSMTASLLQRENELSHINTTLEGQVTERTQALRQANRELARLATIDALTGLHNRRWIDEKLLEHHRSLLRQGRPFAVLVIDVDHFKRINDTHGHGVGDAVLRQLARLLLQSVRTTDYVARYGGEEFVVLLPDTPHASDGLRVAEKIRSTVAGSIFPTVLSMTVSIGLSLSDSTDLQESSVLQRADRGLYLAKEQGRDRVVLVKG